MKKIPVNFSMFLSQTNFGSSFYFELWDSFKIGKPVKIILERRQVAAICAGENLRKDALFMA